jgi:hypothetical protein
MFFYKRFSLAMVVAVVLAVFWGFFSTVPASAMELLGYVPKAEKQVSKPTTDIAPVSRTFIDPNKTNPDNIAFLPGSVLPPFPPPIFPGEIEPDDCELPPYVSLDYKVVEDVDAKGRFLVFIFTGKGPYGSKDGFLVDVDNGACLNRFPAPEKLFRFYRSGERIMKPNFPCTLRAFPAAWGLFSTTKDDGFSTEIKEGYVAGSLYEMTVTSAHAGPELQGLQESTIPQHPYLDPIMVPWSSILRSPQMCPKENPTFNGWRLHKTPPNGPYLNTETDYHSPNAGFWVEAFVHNPDWKALFDGLFVSYQNQTVMEFGSSHSDVTAIGISLKNKILKLPPGQHSVYVDYYPGNERFSILYARAFVKDHHGRYIVPIPTLSRIF